MKYIKTRGRYTGGVRSIDRASVLRARAGARSAAASAESRIKEYVDKDPDRESDYAGGEAEAWADAASVGLRHISTSPLSRVRAGAESSIRRSGPAEREAAVSSPPGMLRSTKTNASALYNNRRQKQNVEAAKKAFISGRRKADFAVLNAKRTAAASAKALKAAVSGTKAFIYSLVTGGGISILIILVLIFMGSAVYLVGNINDGSFDPDDFNGTGGAMLVEVASREVGNVGGYKYWSWYGFSNHVEWCACFVSWCADQCGYIESGAIPKFSVVDRGMEWFMERGLWRGVGYIPSPGDIIFFDWQGDGEPDHVGIVEKIDGRMVYTIEGNSSDMCKRKVYSVSSKEVLGYGVPEY